MKHVLVLACLCTVLLVGCNQQPATPPPKQGGININVPGVNVTVDPNGGTKVTAPGVNVEAGDKGAKVTAPGVNVEAGGKGAKVDVNSKKE